MKSVKCPQCGLVNFVSSQFCKRCNLSLSQFGDFSHTNETQLIDNNHTAFREPVQRQQFGGSPNYHQPEAQRQSPPPPASGWTLPQFPEDERQQFYANESFNQNNFYGAPHSAPPPNYYQQQQNYHQPPMGFAPPPNYYQEPAVRRFGNVIALHKNGSLPSYCVKCGTPISSAYDGLFVAEKFRWHNPLVYIALISPLIYLILALCLSQKFTVNAPLCHEHYKKRQDVKNYMIGGGLLLLPLIFISSSWGYPGFAVLLFFLGLFGLPLLHTYAFKSLTVKEIEGNYYHLKGASPDFLSKIPN